MSRALIAVVSGLGLSLAAAAFGADPLYVLGLTLVVAGLGALAWVWLAPHGARVTRSLDRRTVQEGESFALTVTVICPTLPLAGAVLVPAAGCRPLRMGATRSLSIAAELPAGRRGRWRLAPAQLLVHDPLGLCARELRSQADELLVLPRVEAVRLRDPSGLAGISASAQVAHGAVELELDGLRAYRVGTPAARIHWPTVARTGTLLERRMLDTSDRRPLIVLDPRRPSDAELAADELEHGLDRAARAAASLCVALARRGGCWLTLPGDRRPTSIDADLRTWPALHARLALIALDDPAPRLPSALGAGRRVGAVYWVCLGGLPSPHSPPSSRSFAGPLYRVGPRPLPGRPIAFSVAGCSGQRLRSSFAEAA